MRAITVGQSTALTVGKASVLLPGLLASDEILLGSSRGQALREWQRQAPFLCWAVPDIDRGKVNKIFAAFRDKVSGRMMFQGLRDLNRKTVGVEVDQAEFDAFCRRIGASPDQGLAEDALFEIYAQPGNNVEHDFQVLFGNSENALALQDQGTAELAGCPRLPGGTAPWCACTEKKGKLCWDGGNVSTPLKGWVFGRPTQLQSGSSSFALGPLVASDTETATALILAALRGAAVHHKLTDAKGEIQIELLGEDVETTRLILESLGFKSGEQSLFMVRGSAADIYPVGGRGLIAVSSFEYA